MKQRGGESAMAKRLAIIIITACLLALAVAAYADVVWSNEFYYEHKNEIKRLTRNRFYANGPGGSVFIKEAPSSDADRKAGRAQYSNGKEFTLEGLYIYDGEYWGGNSNSGHSGQICGWVLMKHLLVVYIPADFANENESEFYEYTGNFDSVYAANRLVFWQWPGSDREKRVLESEIYKNAGIFVRYAYKDAVGREWGYVRINNTEGWICFTEPSSINIPAFYPAPHPVKWSPDGIYNWTHAEAIYDGFIRHPQYMLSNITKDKEYKQGRAFTNIPDGAWYKEAIESVYEYGFILGITNYKSDQNETLTKRSAIDIAARIHAHYKYGKEEGDRWLHIYDESYNQLNNRRFIYNANIRYCESEGLIDYGEYDDGLNGNDDSYYKPVTRAELVHIWSKILQPKDMKKQNTVLSLPDVDADTSYYSDIISFYEAGIIGGVDAYGTFKPDDHISTVEAATVLMNLIDVGKRHKGKTYGS